MARATIKLEVRWKNMDSMRRICELLNEIELVAEDMPWRPELSDAIAELRTTVREGIAVKGS